MNITIHPSTLKGHVQAPASKSSMQRACAAALLSNNKTIIRNPGHSNDDKAALDIISKLGAVITQSSGSELEIISSYLQKKNDNEFVTNEINCGESGLSIRMFTPLVALCKNKITIKGEGSLLTRPMDFFDQTLPKLGVQVSTNSGKLPISVQGPLLPKDITIDGSLSSQFLTGLLLAYSSANISTTTTITVIDLKSKPYIDLTLDIMERFGMNVPENRNYEQFVFSPHLPPLPDNQIIYDVEGDWSGGAFLLVAGAIAGDNIKISGLQKMSSQADKRIVDALMNANAGIAMDAKGYTVHAADMTAFEFDATDCPDLFPPLVALAANCQGKTTIQGVSRLAHKESDRGLALQQEFGKMGIKIELTKDEMHIYGGGTLKAAAVHSHNDHRIAMACAVAALRVEEGATTIEDAYAINKSYPDFYRHLKSLGAQITGGIGFETAMNIYKDFEKNNRE